MKLRKYLAAASIAAAEANAARAALIGQLAFYALVLVLYARIWQLIAQKGALAAIGRGDLLWYLAITEWIALSVPPLHLEIERDVRSGNVAYALPRPVSYLWLRFCEGLGAMFLRMLLLGMFGFGLCAILARSAAGPNASMWPSGGPLALLCGTLTAVVAAALNLVFRTLIGLSAFFVQDTSPVYWVWQKLSFAFGGLLFPLDMYPDSLQSIAAATPFPSLLYAPGRIAIGAEPAFAWRAIATLAVWSIMSVLCVHLAFRRAQRALEINGG
ncbi:MAG TPA: ABC-2 family transporter protein [Polyangiaceae bacterium]|jgi:ABC-2 type transport system permease protein|nr:ABC-2 family transporter protein [Polyangiaceae bacterium]